MSARALPKTVWLLGWVSLFMDFSSEMIHSLLPVFLTVNLGASALTLGILEGLAEAAALMVKLFSGLLSDWLGRRKPLILIGYGLAALTKPLFPLADSVATVFAARLTDRLGKGIRGAPRDALIADVAPAEARGACFGLRQSMDTIGAVLGPISAIALLSLWQQDIVSVLWVAVVPAWVAVLLIVLTIKEPETHVKTQVIRPKLAWGACRRFTPALWATMALGALLMLARFSEAFLVLKAQNAGAGLGTIPWVMVLMSLSYAGSAYPAGRLSDRFGRLGLLQLSLAFLLAADIVLAGTRQLAGVWLGSVLWGLHMGFSQGVLSALVAEHAEENLKATAFGWFNLLSGLSLLLASIAAGALWQWQGPSATFAAGALVTICAWFWLLGQQHRLRR